MSHKRNSAVAAPSPATPSRGTHAVTPQIAREMVEDLSKFLKTQAMSGRTTKAHLARLRGKKRG